MEDFANYLYQARTRRRKFISQQKLAKLSTYSQTYISLIETGRVKPSKRCKKAIMRSLEISKVELKS